MNKQTTAQKGSKTPATFEEALESIMPMIYGIVNNTNGVYGLEKEDLQQELMEQAFVSWNRWDPNLGTKFSTYVHTALYNRKNELVRKAKALSRGGGTSPLSLEKGLLGNEYDSGSTASLYEILEDESQNIEDRIAFQELVDSVERIIQSFPPERRQNIIRRCILGGKQTDISRQNNCPQSLVSYYMNTFRIRAWDVLREEGYDVSAYKQPVKASRRPAV